MNRVYVDVREPEEYREGHVDGAINVPMSGLPDAASVLSDLDRSTELVVYCVSGRRAEASIPVLQKLGFEHVINGINEDTIANQ